MKKFLLWLFAFLFMALPATAARADSCSATVFLKDFANGFQTNIQAFDWCFIRVKWWKLNQGPGWKERYCQVSSYKYNGYDYFQAVFIHKDRTYSDVLYTNSIFYALEYDYAEKVGRGWPANFEVQFSPNCGHYD